jgi:hypothetical protein
MDNQKVPASYAVTGIDGEEIFIPNLNRLTEDELKSEGFCIFSEEVQIEQELDWIHYLLEKSGSLAPEVVQFALKYAREDSSLTPAMAMKLGYNEWVK